ncbi:MAG: hypothetical protein C0393_02180 [Anaerolinea sp.]|nr:hypothetical protein [Anaerolinea sp.]
MVLPVYRTVVVTDTCVLINLIHTNRLGLLGRLPGQRFLVPDLVEAELHKPDQIEEFRRQIEAGAFERIQFDDLETLTLFAEHQETLGRGEAACLALAQTRGYSIASDEGRHFRRLAIDTLGQQRLLTTPDLYLLAIRNGLLSVEEADDDLQVLAANRFRVGFTSFRDFGISVPGGNPVVP